MEDTQLKLVEIENGLQSDRVGSDLRSCKDLIKKHQVKINIFLVFLLICVYGIYEVKCLRLWNRMYRCWS